jgi:hypothetical protein
MVRVIVPNNRKVCLGSNGGDVGGDVGCVVVAVVVLAVVVAFLGFRATAVVLDVTMCCAMSGKDHSNDCIHVS